jgi:hypothetical protein
MGQAAKEVRGKGRQPLSPPQRICCPSRSDRLHKIKRHRTISADRIVRIKRDRGSGCSQSGGDRNPISFPVKLLRETPDPRLVVDDIWNNPPPRYGPLVVEQVCGVDCVRSESGALTCAVNTDDAVRPVKSRRTRTIFIWTLAVIQAVNRNL